MNLLFLTIDPFPHVGGKSTHIETLVEGLKAAGHHVTVRSSSDLPTLQKWLIKGVGLLALMLGRERSFCLRTRLRQRLLSRLVAGDLTQLQPTAVILEDPGAYSTIARLGAKPPLIHTVHGDWTNERVSAGIAQRHSAFGRDLLREERDSYQNVDQVITVDTRLRDHVRALAAGVREPIVMPNFIDLDRLQSVTEVERTQARRSLGLGSETMVLCPRRLTPKNGVRYALEALIALRRDGPRDVALWVAGDGPQRTELESLVSQNGAAEYVKLLGDIPHDAITRYFQASDIVIIPSVPSEGVIEATSISALEAMALGIPVVASGIGGLAELIEPEVSGLLAPPADPAALAGALTRLIEEPELAKRLSLGARQRVEARYSHRVAARRVQAIVEQLSDRPVR